ncbi:MAG: four helix bundle protein [Longimicrobiales bacterium]
MRAYQLSLVFYREVLHATRRTAWPERSLCDQLIRAASSISLNIAEGAGEYSVPEKLRFYRIARRSAWECASILELLQVGADRRGAFVKEQQAHLEEISALLTSTILRRQKKTPASKETGPIMSKRKSRARRPVQHKKSLSRPAAAALVVLIRPSPVARRHARFSARRHAQSALIRSAKETEGHATERDRKRVYLLYASCLTSVSLRNGSALRCVSSAFA